MGMETHCQFEVAVGEEDVRAFSGLSGDWNPLHVDPAYAGTTEYGRPIAHGTLLLGYVSRVLGMHIPGRRSLILSMKAQFPKPLFYPSRVQVVGTLKGFNEARGTGLVHVSIVDQEKLWQVVDAEVGFALHAVVPPTGAGGRGAEAGMSLPGASSSAPSAGSSRPRLLVTGGTGGIGAPLLRLLVGQYDICCLTRGASEAGGPASVAYEQVDLEDEQAFRSFLERTPPSGFYGVVHLSVPPVARALVSDDLAAVRRQLRQAVEVPIEFVQWARGPGAAIKRVVLVGSSYGQKFPKPNLGAYSLGKAAMEHLAKLLPVDLAAQGATINVIAPTVIPVGLNEGMPERARKTLLGKMPTGRVVEPSDVTYLVLFLLSEQSAQINGAVIPVDGGVAE